MKSLYYIAPKEKLKRFDALFEKEDLLSTAFDAGQINSLVAFISRDKTIASQSFVILDVGKMEQWSVSHVLSAVQHLRRFSAARLIFVGQSCDELTELYGILANVHHVDDLLTEQPGVDLAAELKERFAEKSKAAVKMQAITEMLAQQAAQVARPLNIPRGLVLRVAVAGTMPRCGATTQTFALYHFLKSVGFRPAILDASNTLVPVLAQYESYERSRDGVVTMRDVSFATQEQERFNAYITDCGTLSADNAASFCNADMSVLVGCVKSWELPAFGEAIRLLLPYSGGRIVTLASFAAQEDMEKLSGYLIWGTAPAPYHPDLWHTPENLKTYSDLLLPELRALCGMEPQYEPELEA